jgi:hypothetical protein
MRKSALAGIVIGLLLFSVACQKMERTPSDKDGAQVWRNLNKLEGPDIAELVAFNKVNGSRGEILGVDSYTLYYQAQIRYTRPALGRAAGSLDTWKGEYTFRKTENGWLGPDNQVY